MVKFDYNIIVIGGGSAGLITALVGSHAKAKVLLIEQNKLGGDCLYTGCVPSKTLIVRLPRQRIPSRMRPNLG